MTKLFMSLVSAIFLSSTLAQVGISTSTPQSTLDINGSIQLRDELRVNGTAGNPGEIYFSRGDIQDPEWIGVNIPFVEEGQYQLVNTYAKKDQVGIDFGTVSNTVVFTESFETAAAFNNWSQSQVTGSGSWTRGGGAGSGAPNSAQSGSNNARFVSMSGTATPITKLISPSINLSGISNPMLSFYYAQASWEGDINNLKVYYRTSPSNAWIEIDHITAAASSWTLRTVALPNPSSTYQIAFEGINNYGRANVVDNIEVYHTPVGYDANLSSIGELITVKGWTRIPGLDIPLKINVDDNKISVAFQTGVESRINSSTGNQTTGNVRYLCGLFQRLTSQPVNSSKLVAVRGDQINNAVGKANASKAQSIFTLNYTVDNTAAGDYTFSVACRRLSLSGGGGTQATALLSIGNSITSGTITNDFMLNSTLKMDVIELVTVTNF